MPGPAATLLAWLGACTVGPDFTPPKPPDVADTGTTRSAQPDNRCARQPGQTNPDPKWWDGFNDPVLTALIEKAITGNLDLQQAVLRVVEARQNEVTARAAGLPTRERHRQLHARATGAERHAAVVGRYGQLNTLANPARR